MLKTVPLTSSPNNAAQYYNVLIYIVIMDLVKVIKNYVNKNVIL